MRFYEYSYDELCTVYRYIRYMLEGICLKVFEGMTGQRHLTSFRLSFLGRFCLLLSCDSAEIAGIST